MALQDLLSRAASLLEREVQRVPCNVPSHVARSKGVVPADPDRGAGLDQPLGHLQTVVAPSDKPNTAPTDLSAGQVPLIWCASRVEAGSDARATITVANEDTHTVEAALYFSNFIADTGYEIASLAAHVSPRAAEIVAGGEAAFDVKLRVPQQTPAGTYSGLVQVTNTKYVKAVLIVEVL